MKRSPQLDRYRRFVGEDILSQIYRTAESLAGLHVLHLNTTAHGGGVAELLQGLIPLMEELGISHTWKVIQLDEASNLLAAHLADLLQGMEHGDIPEADQYMFLEKLRRTPAMSRADQNHADIYFIHDFQLAPLATLFPWSRPAIWMCHVDTTNPEPGGKLYIEQFLRTTLMEIKTAQHLIEIFQSSRPAYHQRKTKSDSIIDSLTDRF